MSAEKKPASLSTTQNFVIGGTSAFLSKATSAPLERLKLLLQCQKEIQKLGCLDTPYKGAINCTVRIYKTEGVLSFWRGFLPSYLGYFTSSILQFAFKDRFKKSFKPSKEDNNTVTLLKNVSAGVAGGLTSLILVYHFDYCRVRLANDVKFGKHGDRKFSGMIDVYKKTLAADGIVGLYRGFLVSCLGFGVYRGLYFGLYDTLKPVVLNKDTNIIIKFILGYSVTLTAGLLVYPLDTIRCRMLMRSAEPVKYKGAFNCLGQIVKTEGALSLWRGVGVRIFQGVLGAFMLIAYDSIKAAFVRK